MIGGQISLIRHTDYYGIEIIVVTVRAREGKRPRNKASIRIWPKLLASPLMRVGDHIWWDHTKVYLNRPNHLGEDLPMLRARFFYGGATNHPDGMTFSTKGEQNDSNNT
jgi:hypothetical protein